MTDGAGDKPIARRLSLRVQVISAMAVVLSPLLFMGATQAWAAQRDTRELRYLALQQGAQDRLREAESIFVRARMVMRMLATEDEKPSCAEIDRRLAPLELPIRNILRFNYDGLVVCHQVGDNLTGAPMPVAEWNERLRRGIESIEEAGQPGMALGDPAIYLLRRQTNDEGGFMGALALTLSIEDIALRMSGGSSHGNLTLALVTGDGRTVGSNMIKSVPRDWLSETTMLDRRLHRITTEQGMALDVVLFPLSVDGLWIMIWDPAPPARMQVMFAFLVPILAYLASLLAASWIADAMVLRWLERIRVRISDMRGSGLYVPLAHEVRRAPAEMQQLVEAFDDLTSRVSTHEADLNRALNQMKAAFREIHHRVKNNLQVMLSMLKLQGRGEPLPQTQSALKVAARRVAMMAAVHHTLLNEGDLDAVEALDLFNAVGSQIDEQLGWTEGGRQVHLDISPCSLPADFAVPLGMFVLEAIGLLCPELDEEANQDVLLRFSVDNGDAQLTLSCGAAGDDDQVEMGRDTHMFLSAFARQVGGTVAVDGESAEKITIQLNFSIADDRAH